MVVLQWPPGATRTASRWSASTTCAKPSSSSASSTPSRIPPRTGRKDERGSHSDGVHRRRDRYPDRDAAPLSPVLAHARHARGAHVLRAHRTVRAVGGGAVDAPDRRELADF